MSRVSIEVVRLGPLTKTRLITLKRRTGIENWNVLSRWAFCLSLSDSSAVGERHLEAGAAIEMTWKTFAGEHEEIYELLLRNRIDLKSDPLCADRPGDLLRAHITRGISRLTATRSIDSLQDLFSLKPRRLIEGVREK